MQYWISTLSLKSDLHSKEGYKKDDSERWVRKMFTISVAVAYLLCSRVSGPFNFLLLYRGEPKQRLSTKDLVDLLPQERGLPRAKRFLKLHNVQVVTWVASPVNLVESKSVWVRGLRTTHPWYVCMLLDQPAAKHLCCLRKSIWHVGGKWRWYTDRQKVHCRDILGCKFFGPWLL